MAIGDKYTLDGVKCVVVGEGKQDLLLEWCHNPIVNVQCPKTDKGLVRGWSNAD